MILMMARNIIGMSTYRLVILCIIFGCFMVIGDLMVTFYSGLALPFLYSLMINSNIYYLCLFLWLVGWLVCFDSFYWYMCYLPGEFFTGMLVTIIQYQVDS